MKIKRIALVEPTSRDYVDFYSLFKMPRGIPLLAAELINYGYEVDCYVESIRKFNINELAKAGYDLIGFSAITCTVNPTCDMIRKLRKAGYKKTIVVGGPHATARPEEVLTSSGADVVVRHEGDKTLPNLIRAIEEEKDLGSVKGISRWKDGNIVHAPDEDFLTTEELSELPIPAFETIKGYERMRHVPLTLSRSCPFHCYFCAVEAMFGKYHCATVESRMRQYKQYCNLYPELWEKYPVFFADDNFFGNKKVARQMLEEMITQKFILPKGWTCQMRVTDAKPDVVELMKKAGCRVVCLGIESVDPETLKALDKRQTVKEIEEGLTNLHNAGIQTVAMTIAGTDTDTFSSVFRGICWLKKISVTYLQILAIVPLPGTKMTYQLVHNEGRDITNKYDRYNGMHVLLKPKNMTKLGVWMAVYLGYLWFYFLNIHGLKLLIRHFPAYYKMVRLVVLQGMKSFVQSIKERIIFNR